MKNILFIAVFAFLSCQPSKESIKIDPKVEKRAIADIEFGMSKAQYDSLSKEFYDVAGLRFYAFPEFTDDGILYQVETGTLPRKSSDMKDFAEDQRRVLGVLFQEYGTDQQDLEGQDYLKKWNYGTKEIFFGWKINLDEYSFYIKFLNDSIQNAENEKSREKIKQEIKESKGVF